MQVMIIDYLTHAVGFDYTALNKHFRRLKKDTK